MDKSTHDTTCSPRTEIEQANARFADRVEKGDAAGLAAMYTDTARLLPPHAAIVEGHAAIEQFWKQAMQQIKRLNLKTTEVESFGDTAIESGLATLYGTGGGIVDNGKYLVVWKRVAGTWQLHRDCWNSNESVARG